MKSKIINIGIITYNRLNLLKKSLECYNNQTCKPLSIYILNNNSNDGTREYLDQWKEKKEAYNKYVLHLNENIGCSSGIFKCMEELMDINGDWIWISDDDAYPENDAVEIIDNFIMDHMKEDITAVCCSVINENTIDLNHRRRIEKNFGFASDKIIEEKEYNKNFFYLNLFSYVGVVINKEKLKDCLPKKEYFIRYDDTEHSYRLSKKGCIVCIPEAKIHHDTLVAKDPIWKIYYANRNKMDFYKTHFIQTYYFLYFYKKIKIYLGKILYRRKLIEYNARLEAINDANNGKLGFNKKYSV